MTAASSWEPGEPFLPDNGCGSIPVVNWTEQERHAAIAEDDNPPPWFRPHEPTTAYGMVRSCHTCGVQWRGDDLPCWMCGGQVLLP